MSNFNNYREKSKSLEELMNFFLTKLKMILDRQLKIFKIASKRGMILLNKKTIKLSR